MRYSQIQNSVSRDSGSQLDEDPWEDVAVNTESTPAAVTQDAHIHSIEIPLETAPASGKKLTSQQLLWQSLTVRRFRSGFPF